MPFEKHAKFLLFALFIFGYFGSSGCEKETDYRPEYIPKDDGDCKGLEYGFSIPDYSDTTPYLKLDTVGIIYTVHAFFDVCCDSVDQYCDTVLRTYFDTSSSRFLIKPFLLEHIQTFSGKNKDLYIFPTGYNNFSGNGRNSKILFLKNPDFPGMSYSYGLEPDSILRKSDFQKTESFYHKGRESVIINGRNRIIEYDIAKNSFEEIWDMGDSLFFNDLCFNPYNNSLIGIFQSRIYEYKIDSGDLTILQPDSSSWEPDLFSSYSFEFTAKDTSLFVLDFSSGLGKTLRFDLNKKQWTVLSNFHPVNLYYPVDILYCLEKNKVYGVSTFWDKVIFFEFDLTTKTWNTIGIFPIEIMPVNGLSISTFYSPGESSFDPDEGNIYISFPANEFFKFNVDSKSLERLKDLQLR